MAIPVSGREVVDARWDAVRPILSQIADDLLAAAPGRADAA
jgi:hypothetical protein